MHPQSAIQFDAKNYQEAVRIVLLAKSPDYDAAEDADLWAAALAYDLNHYREPEES